MLIKTIQEFERWFPNSTYRNFEKLAAFFSKAEYKHLRPILGTPLYQALQGEYDKEEEIQEDWDKLLVLSQALIVHFAVHDALPMLNVTLNQFGSLSVTQNDNMAPASKDRTEKLEVSLWETAWDDVEQLLLFLEEKSSKFTDNEDQSKLWEKSEWYARQTGCLIFTAQEFNEIVYIANSRVRFKRIYPILRKIERIKLRPIFGKELIDALINRKMNGKLKEHDKEVLEHMQSALALLAIPEDEELSKPDNIHGYKPFEATFQAEQEINACKRILSAYPGDYPEYPANKKGYEPVEPFKNSSDNSVFFLGGTTL